MWGTCRSPVRILNISGFAGLLLGLHPRPALCQPLAPLSLCPLGTTAFLTVLIRDFQLCASLHPLSYLLALNIPTSQEGGAKTELLGFMPMQVKKKYTFLWFFSSSELLKAAGSLTPPLQFHKYRNIDLSSNKGKCVSCVVSLLLTF